jgi:hypothetical protein
MMIAFKCHFIGTMKSFPSFEGDGPAHVFYDFSIQFDIQIAVLLPGVFG